MCKRAVITGIGLLTPLGNKPAVFFSNALAGVCGVGLIRKFDASNLDVRIGAEIASESQRVGVDAELASMPSNVRWAVMAARAALKDSGLDVGSLDPYSIDVLVGVSVSAIEHLSQQYFQRNEAGELGLTPATPTLLNPAAAAIQISRDSGLLGESINITTACSSSTTALGYAARLIQQGDSTCVISGGADEGVSRLFLGSYGSVQGGLSHRNEDPAHACRPFDRTRDGPVFGDAACILVLEEYERAKARGANIYCELSGYAGTSDGSSAYKLSVSEEPSARALSRAIGRARRNVDEIDYYCAHGIAHSWLDIRETRMLRRVFGHNANQLQSSSLKAMMGHALGAAGAVQAATCALAIRHGAIPPTINYCAPDPQCDLDFVPNEARSIRVRNAALYSLGNGGCNAALVLSAC